MTLKIIVYTCSRLNTLWLKNIPTRFKRFIYNWERKWEKASAKKTFQERYDELIDVANHHHAETEVDNVNAAILFSASRFNVFTTVRQFDDVEKLKEEKQKIIEYFTQRFAEMMASNLDEYIERFDEYNPN